MENEEQYISMSPDEFIKYMQSEGVVKQESPKIPKLSKKEENYFRDISKIIGILGACNSVMTPSGVMMDYLIKEEDYRLELQGYIMSLVRNNLKNTISVNTNGIKIKKSTR